MNYWTKTDRVMLAAAKEVGAMPFILFQYYLTWEGAASGIKPSLDRVAGDLQMEKNAICNLRSRLIKAGWIAYENGEVLILKSFTKNESGYSQKMNPPEKSFTKNESDSQFVNNHSQKMNKPFTNCESALKGRDRTLRENKTEHTDTKARVRPPVPDKVSPEENTVLEKFVRECLVGLREIQNLNIISDEPDWYEKLEVIFANNFKPAEVLETYQLTKKQKWRRGRITPKIVADNISNLEKIRAEILEQESQNGTNKSNPNSQQTPAEIIRNRSYRRRPDG